VKVLVDYSNAIGEYSSVIEMIESITEEICSVLKNVPKRLSYRVYGGWYKGNKYTRLAQRVSVDLNKEYTSTYRPIEEIDIPFVMIEADLAYSLLSEPSHNLVRTYREKPGRSHSVWINEPELSGCSQDNCHLKGLLSIFQSGDCTHPSCSLGASELVGDKREQKLVDTMMVSDMIYLSYSGEDTISIVSSDDDMIPGVRNSLTYGTKVVHIHTGSRKSTPNEYIMPTRDGYIQSCIR